MTLWTALGMVVLAAAPPSEALPVPTDSGPHYASEEALRRYAQGVLLEQRGELRPAQSEYFRALLLDPRAATVARRISAISASLSEYDRSLEFAERTLALRPDDAPSLWLKGAALANLGRAREALAPLRGAVASDSLRPHFLRTLALVAEQAGDLATLEWASRRLVRLDPDDAEAWFQLAGAAARVGRYREAESLLAVSEGLNPLRPGLHLFGARVQEALAHWPEAAAEYRRHLTVAEDDGGSRRRLINALLESGETLDAYEEAGRLAVREPRDLAARQLEVELAYECARPRDAERSLRRLLGDWPGDAQATLFAVTVLARHRRGAQARALGETFAAKRPADAQAWQVAARAYALSGDTNRAAERLRRAIQLAPDSLAPRAMLARLYQDARRFTEGAAAWEEAERRFPGEDRVALELAYCREQLGDLAGAEAAIRGVLARAPNHPTALNFLGYMLADHNLRLEEAKQLIERALAQQPDNGAFMDSLGWVYFRMGRIEEARLQLERALGRTHGDPEVHEHLGDVYKALSKTNLAKEHYRKSLAVDGHNRRVREKLDELR